MVPPGSRIADIGTDHGLLPFFLLSSGRVRHCVATEVTEALLAPLRHRMKDSDAPGLELRAGRGLAPLHRSDRLDVLVLAGMGSSTIRAILSRDRIGELGVSRVVIQPQTDHAEIRRHLTDLRMRIVEEELLRLGGGYHLVVAAETGHPDILDAHPLLGEDDLMEAGPCLVRSGSGTVREYWEGQFRRNARILDIATAGLSRREAARMRELAVRVLRALPEKDRS